MSPRTLTPLDTARQMESEIEDDMEMRDRLYAVADGPYPSFMREDARRRADSINASVCQKQMLFWAVLMENGLTPEALND